jgi:hypothetical protein
MPNLDSEKIGEFIMGLDVCKKQCNQCLFSKNRIVSEKRFIEIIKDCAVKDTYFICHKASIAKKDICCRGFYEQFSYRSKHIAMAKQLGVLNFVDVPKVEDPKPKKKKGL